MRWMFSANYTAAAIKAIGQNPTDRRAAATKLVQEAGGEVVAFYRTLTTGPGVVMIFEADPIAAAAINCVVVAGGAVEEVKLLRLWDDDDVTAIRKKRAQIEASYKPPTA